MDFGNIANAISTVGFPIVMCLIMFYQLQKSDEKHREEVQQLSEAINNNTLVMQKILDKVGVNS